MSGALFLFGQTFWSVTRPTFWPIILDSWVEPWRGSRSPRDPGFMNPTGAPEPPGDLSRIVQGIFLSCQWVHASAPAGVAPEPSGGSGRTVWGCCFSGHVCF